jgi:transcriptional regulator with XRE-family HTH domain
MHEARLAIARRDLGRNMQRLRAERGLTQKGAASLAGLHWRHWQKMEAQETNVTLETLAKIAGALGVEVVTLFLPPLQ